MIVGVKIIGLKNEGLKKVQIKKKIETDNVFVDTESVFEGRTLVHTAFDKADEWFSNTDKKYIMDEEDLYLIENWIITSLDGVHPQVNIEKKHNAQLVETSKQSVKDIIEELFSESSPQFIADFAVVMNEMHSVIKDLKPEKQIMIVMKTMGVGYDASKNALENLMNFQKKLELLSYEELTSKHWTHEELDVYLEERKKMIPRLHKPNFKSNYENDKI